MKLGYQFPFSICFFCSHFRLQILSLAKHRVDCKAVVRETARSDRQQVLSVPTQQVSTHAPLLTSLRNTEALLHQSRGEGAVYRHPLLFWLLCSLFQAPSRCSLQTEASKLTYCKWLCRSCCYSNRCLKAAPEPLYVTFCALSGSEPDACVVYVGTGRAASHFMTIAVRFGPCASHYCRPSTCTTALDWSRWS